VARWLRYWLAQAEPYLRPSTPQSYRDHIDRYLIPSLGRITLGDLTGKRLQACCDLLARQRTWKGTPIAGSTVDRVRATLRAAPTRSGAVAEFWNPAGPLPARPLLCNRCRNLSTSASSAHENERASVAWSTNIAWSHDVDEGSARTPQAGAVG
jgi:hypothetical protein